MRGRLPSACPSRRARARAVARAAARGRARRGCVRRRGRRRARARAPRRRSAAHPGEDGLRQRGRPARAPHGARHAFGRYLDSECDLLVNAALFAGLGWYTGEPVAAALGFVALTAVLSVNFNVERLARGAPAVWDASLLGRVYGLLYGWQDRLAERFIRERPALGTVGALAQLGMSSQLAAFGLCLAVGRPLVYVWLLLAQVVFVAGLCLLAPSTQEVSLEHR